MKLKHTRDETGIQIKTLAGITGRQVMLRQEFDHKSMQGVDADIETSLREYGFAWIEAEEEVLFYYGIMISGEDYIKFDFCSFDKDIDIKSEFDWADFDEVEESIGIPMEELSMIDAIYELFKYYGAENVFGTTYYEGLTYRAVINPSVMG